MSTLRTRVASGSKGFTGVNLEVRAAAVVWRRAVGSSMLHLCTMSHNRVDVNIIMSCTIPGTSTATWGGGAEMQKRCWLRAGAGKIFTRNNNIK